MKWNISLCFFSRNIDDLVLLHDDFNFTFLISLVAGLSIIVLFIQRSPDQILFTFKVDLPFGSLVHHVFPHFTFRLGQCTMNWINCTLSFILKLKTLPSFSFLLLQSQFLIRSDIITLIYWSTSYSDQTVRNHLNHLEPAGMIKHFWIPSVTSNLKPVQIAPGYFSKKNLTLNSRLLYKEK